MTTKIIRSDGVTQIQNIKSCVYTEKVNSDVDLRPGCVASASIAVEVFGPQTSAPSAGEALKYYQVQNGVETLIGTFYAEPSIPTKNTFAFRAYDAVGKLDVDYSERLNAIQDTFPMTVRDLVLDACAVAGVTLSSATWPLSAQTVNAFYADGLTCRNILQYAAEIACRFVRCNQTGQIVFDWYSASQTEITPGSSSSSVAYKQNGLRYENYDTAALDGVRVHPVGEDDVAYIYPSAASGNVLDIRNNPLLYGASAATMTAIAQNIYTELSSVTPYRPLNVSLFPFENPFRAGQIVTVTDAQGVSFTSVLMGMTVSAELAELESTGHEEYAPETNLQKAVAQLASDVVQIGKLKVDWADIGTAIIDTLEANGINADWIDTGSITITYKDEHDEEWNILSADVSDKTLMVGPWNVSRYGDFKMTYTHSSVSETTNFGGGLSAHYAANGLPGVGYSTEKYGETYKRGITNYSFMNTGPNISPPSPWRNYFKPDVDNQVGLDIYFTDTIGNNSGVELNEDGIWVASTGGIYVWNNSHAKYIDVAEKIAEVDSTVMRVGAAGTWADSTVQLPTTPTATGATQNVVFSLPTGATLVGVTLTATSSAVALVSNRIISNTAVQVRAYSLAIGTTFTWADVTARPIYTL